MAPRRLSTFATPFVNGRPGGRASKFLRVDFDTFAAADFAAFIETKTPRLGWARATLCPCVGFSVKTKQIDPDCSGCNGLGWTYFRPPNFVVNSSTLGNFDGEQKAALDRAKAVPIRGFMISIQSDPTMFHVLGEWAFGSSQLTVRGENKLGYYDRILSIDETMTYSETRVTDGSGALPTRYSVVQLNDVRTHDAVLDVSDVTLVDGVLTWRAGKEPALGARVSLNYLCHPVWVVAHFTHLVRTSLRSTRTIPANRQTPEGDALTLPMQVLVRLEHLEMNPKE